YQIDHDDIARLGAEHDNWPGYRSEGVSITSRCEGVGTALMSSTSSKAPCTSTVNSSPESTVIVGGVWVLTEEDSRSGWPSRAALQALKNAHARIAAHLSGEAIGRRAEPAGVTGHPFGRLGLCLVGRPGRRGSRHSRRP